MFDVKQGLRKGRVLAPLLLNSYITAVLRVAETRSVADAAVVNNIVQLQRKKEQGERKRCKTRAGNADGGEKIKKEEVHSLWGLRYVDDADIAARPRGDLDMMVSMVVLSCASFGPTASETKTEIVFL